jgi:hypothetical protein
MLFVPCLLFTCLFLECFDSARHGFQSGRNIPTSCLTVSKHFKNEGTRSYKKSSSSGTKEPIRPKRKSNLIKMKVSTSSSSTSSSNNSNNSTHSSNSASSNSYSKTSKSDSYSVSLEDKSLSQLDPDDVPFAKIVPIEGKSPTATFPEWFHKRTCITHPKTKSFKASPFCACTTIGATYDDAKKAIYHQSKSFGLRAKENFILVSDGLARSGNGAKGASYRHKEAMIRLEEQWFKNLENFKQKFSVAEHALTVGLLRQSKDSHFNIILRSFGNPPLAAMILRPFGETYKPILFSVSGGLVRGKVKTGDLVVVGMHDIVCTNRANRLRFPRDASTETIAKQIFDSNWNGKGLVVVCNINLDRNRGYNQ